MIAPSTSTTSPPIDTSAEQETLSRHRDRYQQGHDLFTGQELARLRFVRWLYETGRLLSWGRQP